MSGLFDGQGIGWMWWVRRCCIVCLAVWGWALSCINRVLWFCWRNEITQGSMIWLIYRAAVRLPCTIWISVEDKSTPFYEFAASAVSIPLDNTLWFVSFPKTTVDILIQPPGLDSKRRFIVEENLPPLIVIPIITCRAPRQPGPFVLICDRHSFSKLLGFDVKTFRAILLFVLNIVEQHLAYFMP